MTIIPKEFGALHKCWPNKYIHKWIQYHILHTHLLRNILSNYGCGMHRPCKNTSVKPDRQWWMTRREKQYRRILSTTLLDATVPSDEVSSSSDCRSCTDIKWKVGLKNWKSWKTDMPVLGLAGRHFGRWKNAGTFSRPTSKVFVGSGLEVGPRAPCLTELDFATRKKLSLIGE